MVMLELFGGSGMWLETEDGGVKSPMMSDRALFKKSHAAQYFWVASPF